MYRCIICGKQFEGVSGGNIRCPACAGRIVEKMRPPITKKLLAK
jgi:DNA-directed RNA polymerase subunit RPC12/RpoP